MAQVHKTPRTASNGPKGLMRFVPNELRDSLKKFVGDDYAKTASNYGTELPHVAAHSHLDENSLTLLNLVQNGPDGMYLWA